MTHRYFGSQEIFESISSARSSTTGSTPVSAKSSLEVKSWVLCDEFLLDCLFHWTWTCLRQADLGAWHVMHLLEDLHTFLQPISQTFEKLMRRQVLFLTSHMSQNAQLAMKTDPNAKVNAHNTQHNRHNRLGKFMSLILATKRFVPSRFAAKAYTLKVSRKQRETKQTKNILKDIKT